jgi:hypothetical protein
VEEGVDEAGGHAEKLGHLGFEEIIIMLVLLGGYVKVLLDLAPSSADVRDGVRVRTVKSDFSSLRLFSFFSLSLLKLLLCRSKSTSLWSRFTQVLRIFLQISCNSVQG